MNPSPVTFEEIGATALKAQIDLKACPERVYAAWTEPERFVRWFGPRQGGSLEVDRFECAAGGGYDVTMVFADGDRVRLTGEYLELDPPRRIVFSWRWTGDPAGPQDTRVTVELAPWAEGTRLTLVHERFPSSEMREQHEQGWAPLLERLAAVLSDPTA